MIKAENKAVSRKAPTPLRYAYVKNGDAVEQVRRFVLEGKSDGSGPDAFIGDFLQAHAGDEVVVLCRSNRRASFKHGNLRADSFPALGSSRLMRNGWAALRIGVEILRFKPDRIVCGCNGELLWVATAASRILRVPIVDARHNEVIERAGIGRIASMLDRLSIRAGVGVVCHGPFLAKQIRDMGVAEDRTRQFEVDLTDFAATPGELLAPEELREFGRRFDVLFAFVGRIQLDKGVCDLLNAFADLVQGGNARIGLVYVGDGKDLELLKRRIRERDVGDRVLMLGRIPHVQLPSMLRHVDVLVAPTRPEFPEGRCMVVLEALVLGVPVIGPEFGPFPYAVQHQVSGLLFEAGSADDLCRALAIVLQPEELERLRRGATVAGRDLLASRLGFAQAVDLTFAVAEVRD